MTTRLLCRQERAEVHAWQNPAASLCMFWSPSKERAAKPLVIGGKAECSRTQKTLLQSKKHFKELKLKTRLYSSVVFKHYFFLFPHREMKVLTANCRHKISICTSKCIYILRSISILYLLSFSWPLQTPRALSARISSTLLFTVYKSDATHMSSLCPVNLKKVIFKVRVTWKVLILSNLSQLVGMA